MTVPTVQNDGIYFHYYDTKRSSKLYIRYDFNGNLIEEKKNPHYKDMAEISSVIDMDADVLRRFYSMPRGLTEFNNGYVQYYPGEYHIEYLTKNKESIVHITKNYDRIKDVPINLLKNQKGQSAKMKKHMQLMMSARQQAIGDYKSDVQSILGTTKDFIYLRTSTKSNKELNIDVISVDFTYVTHLKIEGDEILSASIEQNKLLVNFKNAEEGPYLKIYDIIIN